MQNDPIWLHGEFWLAAAFAAVVKVTASPRASPLATVATVFIAVAGAALFTDWAAEVVVGVHDGGPKRYAIAALVAMSCEEVAKRIVRGKVDLLALWRGRK